MLNHHYKPVTLYIECNNHFSVFMDKFTGGLCVTILVAKQAQAAKHVLVEMFDVQ